jgi:group I intron endonuclease
MDQGIYKIVNIVNDNFYVGSAVSFKKRKVRHFSDLRKGKHYNKHLQRAWDKYGEQSFEFVVVEVVADRAVLLDIENKWLKPNVGKPHCYNTGTDASAPSLGMSGELSPSWGRKHTSEAKELIRASSAGRLHTQEAKDKIKQYFTGKPRSAETKARISKAISGPGNHNFGKPRSREFVEKIKKPIEAINPDGVVTRYDSIMALRESMNLKPSTINRALKSGKPLVRGPRIGWVFKYAT